MVFVQGEAEQRAHGPRRDRRRSTRTLLTLFVVAVGYALLDDLVARLRRGRGAGHHDHAYRVVPAPALAREPEPVAATKARRRPKRGSLAGGPAGCNAIPRQPRRF